MVSKVAKEWRRSSMLMRGAQGPKRKLEEITRQGRYWTHVELNNGKTPAKTIKRLLEEVYGRRKKIIEDERWMDELQKKPTQSSVPCAAQIKIEQDHDCDRCHKHDHDDDQNTNRKR